MSRVLALTKKYTVREENRGLNREKNQIPSHFAPHYITLPTPKVSFLLLTKNCCVPTLLTVITLSTLEGQSGSQSTARVYTDFSVRVLSSAADN